MVTGRDGKAQEADGDDTEHTRKQHLQKRILGILEVRSPVCTRIRNTFSVIVSFFQTCEKSVF